MRALLCPIVVLVLGCGRIAFDPIRADDGGNGSDGDSGGPDAALVCGAYGAPYPLAALDSTSEDWGGWMSEDRLEVYFTSDRSGNLDIFYARRADASSAFGTPTRVTELATGSPDDDAVLMADGLTMYISSYRVSGNADSWLATRPTTASPFTVIGPVTALNSNSDDGGMEFDANEQFVYFTSVRPGGGGTGDIYRASHSGGVFGTPVREAVSTNQEECCATVMADDRHVLFSQGATLDTRQIMIADRDPVTGEISNPSPFAPLTSVGNGNHDPFIVGYDELIGFASNRPGAGGPVGGYNLWAIERTCD